MDKEITIDEYSLENELRRFKKLQEGTGYRIYTTTELINLGKGRMFEEINKTYKEFCLIEENLLELITKTGLVLNKALNEFIIADENCRQLMDDIVKHVM